MRLSEVVVVPLIVEYVLELKRVDMMGARSSVESRGSVLIDPHHYGFLPIGLAFSLSSEPGAGEDGELCMVQDP